MLIRLGYDIQFDIPAPVAMVALLNVHPSRVHDLLEPDELQIEPKLRNHQLHRQLRKPLRPVRCALRDMLRLSSSTLIQDSGQPDDGQLVSPREGRGRSCPTRSSLTCSIAATARSIASPTSPLSSLDTYHPAGAACRPSATGSTTKWRSTISRPGPPRPPSTSLPSVSACAATFSTWPSPSAARSTFPLAMPPATSATSVSPCVLPMDFSAWFEVYLDDRWWTFDARNNQPRIGRVLMATGRDASDVAMTTSFGQADLRHFFVVTEEDTTAAQHRAQPAAADRAMSQSDAPIWDSHPTSSLAARRVVALRASTTVRSSLVALSAILWNPPSLSTTSGV